MEVAPQLGPEEAISIRHELQNTLGREGVPAIEDRMLDLQQERFLAEALVVLEVEFLREIVEFPNILAL
jgi:hypothetical protein